MLQAIAILTTALAVAEHNEPLQRADGRTAQADLSAQTAREIRSVLDLIAARRAAPAVPFLYVDEFGPSVPVVTVGNSMLFVWEPAVGKHVHRFADLADFLARAHTIIHEERLWKIYPGFDAAVTEPPALLPAEAVQAGPGENEGGEPPEEPAPDPAVHIVAAVEAIATGELTLEDFADEIRAHPAVQAVADLRTSAQAPATLSEHALKREVSRREAADLRTIMGLDFMPEQLVAKYAALVSEKSGRPVALSAEVSVKPISQRSNWGFRECVGFRVNLGEDRHASAGLEYEVRDDSQAEELRRRACAALSVFFQNPDSRIVADYDEMTGHDLHLLVAADGSMSIAPPDYQPPVKDEVETVTLEFAKTANGVQIVQAPADSARAEPAAPEKKKHPHKKKRH